MRHFPQVWQQSPEEPNRLGMQEIAQRLGNLLPLSAFSAYREADYTMSGNSEPVVFDTLEFDVLQEYDRLTGAFTPKDDGLYVVSAGVKIDGGGIAGNGLVSIHIQVDDLSYYYYLFRYQNTTAGGIGVIAGTRMIYLPGGRSYFVWPTVIWNAAPFTLTGGLGNMWFSATRIR